MVVRTGLACQLLHSSAIKPWVKGGFRAPEAAESAYLALIGACRGVFVIRILTKQSGCREQQL